LAKLSGRFQIEIYQDSELAKRVMAWFDRMYGERLKLGLSLGATAIVIGGDLYRVLLPLWFGTLGFVFDGGPLEREQTITQLGSQRLNISNVVRYAEGLTIARVMDMELVACAEIVDWFGKAMFAAANVSSVKFPDFLSEARSDLGSSVDYMVAKNPQYGLSRWSSLQAVEKFLKAFIKERGATISRIHMLADLASDAEAFGLNSIDRSELAKAQCTAGVRYGSEPSTMKQALDAHRAATEICGAIAAQFKNRDEWQVFRTDGQTKDGQRRLVILYRVTQADIDRAQATSRTEPSFS
jgi:hypothetical protein